MIIKLKNIGIVEVSGSAGAKKDFQKVKELADDYKVQEAFVYDYGFQTWRKYRPGRSEVTDQPSFCEAIEMNLAQLLTTI